MLEFGVAHVFHRRCLETLKETHGDAFCLAVAVLARTVEQLSVYVPRAVRALAGPVLRRMIGRTPVVQGLGRLPYPVLIREVGERLDDLVLLLAQRSFFYASRPSVADFALFGQFKAGCSGPTPDFEQLVSERPTLADWMKRVEDAARC